MSQGKLYFDVKYTLPAGEPEQTIKALEYKLNAEYAGRPNTEALRTAMQAEVDRALGELAQKISTDLYGPRRRPVRLYGHGNPLGDPTWVGTCTLCGAREVSNLDPRKHLQLPDACGEGGDGGGPTGIECTGQVLLDQEWEALLAAFLVGGWEALAR